MTVTAGFDSYSWFNNVALRRETGRTLMDNLLGET